MGKGCTCGACGRCKAGRITAAKYLFGIVAIAVIALLAVKLLNAEGSMPPELSMNVLAPSCSEPAAVFVQLASDEPISGANVDVLMDGRFIERLKTDGNGRFFTVLDGDWCASEHTVTARYGEISLSKVITIGETDIVRDTQEAPTVVSNAGGRLSSLVAQLQQNVVKIEMPGSRGSGIIMSQADGKTVILTNRHVIEPAKSLGAIDVTAWDHRSVHPAAIYLAPHEMDLAIVVVEGTLGTPAQIESGEYLVGDDVIALGSPRGIQGSVSKGIISNFGDDKSKGGFKHEIIQTDTAINKGNSGGGLFLASTGKLIGINTFQMKDAEGLNFAVDIHELSRLGSYTEWDTFR